MGCCHSILCCRRITEEERLIADIFDTMTSDAELTEACVIAVAERSQELVVSDLEAKKSILCEQIEQVRDSNAIDLLLISITDEKGNITFELFKEHFQGRRPEEYRHIKGILKRIRLHRGNIKSKKNRKSSL